MSRSNIGQTHQLVLSGAPRADNAWWMDYRLHCNYCPNGCGALTLSSSIQGHCAKCGFQTTSNRPSQECN